MSVEILPVVWYKVCAGHAETVQTELLYSTSITSFLSQVLGKWKPDDWYNGLMADIMAA